MTINQVKLKALDGFFEIAKKQEYHVNVMLAVASVVLANENYNEAAKEITQIAERCESCDEFLKEFTEKY